MSGIEHPPVVSEPAVEARAFAKLGELLSRDDLKVFDEAHRKKLLGEWQCLGEEEAHLDDRLLIGLIGGTGVGKSTFINALAGEKVSKSGDRRPTTSRVIVYRHVETELPDDVPRVDLSQPQVLHSRESLRRVTLLDFPDFDSAESTHAAVLDRYLRHLDVLFVLVDDVKYGDRRLYDLLRELRHDPRNLYVILNKTDRLDERYRERSLAVAREILDDLRVKLAEHSAIVLPPERVLAVSALHALENRLAQGRLEASSEPLRREGDFDRVEELLASYREEKRRRAAKSLNIETRKEKLLRDIAAAALTPENRALLEESEELVRKWRDELRATLAAIPTDVLSEAERAALRRSRWRWRRASFGAIAQLVGGLFGRARRSGAVALESGPDLTRRLDSHYRPYFQALENLEIRFRSEFSTGLGKRSRSGRRREPAESIRTTALLEPHATSLISAANANDLDARRGPRWVIHAPALAVLLLALWGIVHRVLEALISPDAKRGFFAELVAAIVDVLDPGFIAGVVLGIVAAYAGTIFVLWARESAQLEAAVLEAEKRLRAEVHAYGDRILDRTALEVSALRDEIALLEEIIPRRWRE